MKLRYSRASCTRVSNTVANAAVRAAAGLRVEQDESPAEALLHALPPLNRKRSRGALPFADFPPSCLELLAELIDFEGPVILMCLFAVLGEFGAIEVPGGFGFGGGQPALKFGDIGGQ